ncbi:hypothetical protein SARC_18018, partial [Sphaeroforma arctica JP610]
AQSTKAILYVIATATAGMATARMATAIMASAVMATAGATEAIVCVAEPRNLNVAGVEIESTDTESTVRTKEN